ncbi:MAG: histidine kinase [Anabaena sp. CRKS33]|jgi:signal transduction histidine kinase|nr:MAG: histidine kinase [Anabaena sp. CRKS33]
MNFSNWLYLGIGIGIGLCFYKLLLESCESSPISALNASQHQETELLQELQQTQLAYHKAQEMSQFKAGFLARISHELRSPLSSIIGLHQLILADLCENPEEEREFIGQSHEKSLKLLKLIDEILNISKIESGRNKLDIHSFQLAEFLEEVYKLTYLLAANRNYPFTLSPPDPKIYIFADSRWLKQILINLIESTIEQIEAGNIYLSSHLSSTGNFVNICVDVPNDAVIISESMDLIKGENSTFETSTVLSPGMKLLLNQTLVDLMGGKLEILPLLTQDKAIAQSTRLQISIPLTN